MCSLVYRGKIVFDSCIADVFFGSLCVSKREEKKNWKKGGGKRKRESMHARRGQEIGQLMYLQAFLYISSNAQTQRDEAQQEPSDQREAAQPDSSFLSGANHVHPMCRSIHVHLERLASLPVGEWISGTM